MKTYTIELRVDIPEDEDREQREQIIRQAARQAARTLLATAALISQKRKPVIAVHSNDYFEGVKEVEILDDENNSAMEANHDGGTGSEVEEGTSATVEPA